MTQRRKGQGANAVVQLPADARLLLFLQSEARGWEVVLLHVFPRDTCPAGLGKPWFCSSLPAPFGAGTGQGCAKRLPQCWFSAMSVFPSARRKGLFLMAVLLWCSWGLCRNGRGAVRASPAEPVVPPPASSPGTGSLLVHPKGANAGKLKWQEMGLEHHQNWDFLIPRKLTPSTPKTGPGGWLWFCCSVSSGTVGAGAGSAGWAPRVSVA